MRSIQSFSDHVAVLSSVFGWRVDALLIGVAMGLLIHGYRRVTPVLARLPISR